MVVRTPALATTLRSTARILSGLILLVWGTFLAAHLLGDAGRASRPLVGSDYVLLAATAASLLGLALAWVREFAGAVLTLLAVAISAGMNWKVLVLPGMLIPIAALLFLASWWVRRVSGGVARIRAE
jgi:hypothetical protein